jgi:hypothetical protein
MALLFVPTNREKSFVPSLRVRVISCAISFSGSSKSAASYLISEFSAVRVMSFFSRIRPVLCLKKRSHVGKTTGSCLQRCVRVANG